MNNTDMTSIINNQIEEFRNKEWFNPDNVYDWYHTFWELYKHRIHLFIALCKSKLEIEALNKIQSELCETIYTQYFNIIKSKLHFDWSEWEWWFIVQLKTPSWQISYHLPNEYWEQCEFIDTVEKANEWDWHTSGDVLERLLLI
jgi:hypothetical protein